MNQIKTTLELQETIRLLEIQQLEEINGLKKQVDITIDNLKPFNILKNTLQEITLTPSFKENALETVLSMAVGFISKKIIVSTTHNPTAKALGNLIQLGVTSLVAKNSSNIKNTAVEFLRKFLQKKSTHF